MKLLETIISDELKWNKNTSYLVKEAYSGEELLRRIKYFTKYTTDKLHIYKTFIRNNLEQSCVVLGSSISKNSKY